MPPTGACDPHFSQEFLPENSPPASPGTAQGGTVPPLASPPPYREGSPWLRGSLQRSPHEPDVHSGARPGAAPSGPGALGAGPQSRLRKASQTLEPRSTEATLWPEVPSDGMMQQYQLHPLDQAAFSEQGQEHSC